MTKKEYPAPRHINLPVFISELACPGRCIFCNQSRITGHERPPTPEQASRIIATCMATVPEDAEVEIAFFGGSFTALPFALQRAYLNAAQSYASSGRIAGIRVSTRPDRINNSTLDLLDHYSVTTIELGVQSFDDRVLAGSRRGYDAATAIRACQLVKSRGFKLSVQLMIGLPGDSRQACRKSVSQSASLGADMARIYPTLVLKDTELADMTEAGSYIPLDLDEAISRAAEMLISMEAHGIQVIRIGLQSNTDLQPGQSIMAGPYHPAFGELVEQFIYYDLASQALEEFSRQGIAPNSRKEGLEGLSLTLLVPAGHLSKMIGQHQANVLRLTAKYRLSSLKVAESPRSHAGRRVELISDH